MKRGRTDRGGLLTNEQLDTKRLSVAKQGEHRFFPASTVAGSRCGNSSKDWLLVDAFFLRFEKVFIEAN